MKYSVLAVIVLLSSLLVGGVSADNITPIGGDLGTYRIHGNVEAARVYFDGEYQGNITSGFLDVPVYLTGTPYRSFSLEKEGYYRYSGQLGPVPAKGSHVNIYATMSAIPPIEYGTLNLLVTPAFSSVSLDGKSVGLVPATGILIIRNVVPGNHVVLVSKQGYKNTTGDVTVSKNEIKNVFLNLTASERGPLLITSTPAGAQVILDEQPVGTSPLSLSEVSVGLHRIALKMEGYNDYTETISVAGDGATVAATLIPAPGTGATTIGLSPFGLMGALLGVFLLMGLKWHHR
jgi:hypothetical protein